MSDEVQGNITEQAIQDVAEEAKSKPGKIVVIFAIVVILIVILIGFIVSR